MAKLTTIFYKVAMSKHLRIKTIQSLVSADETDIYDLCCDHGLIGIGLINQNRSIEFIDSVGPIMEGLVRRLKELVSDIPSGLISTKISDATKFTPKKDNGLYIIAGIGGDLALRIIKNIVSKDEKPTFIINVNNNQIKVRDYFIKMNFFLHEELLIRENNVFHEIFKVSKAAGHEISLIGTKMWQTCEKDKIDYLNQKILYHEKGAKFSKDSKVLLDAYLDTKAKCIVKIDI